MTDEAMSPLRRRMIEDMRDGRSPPRADDVERLLDLGHDVLLGIFVVRNRIPIAKCLLL